MTSAELKGQPGRDQAGHGGKSPQTGEIDSDGADVDKFNSISLVR